MAKFFSLNCNTMRSVNQLYRLSMLDHRLVTISESCDTDFAGQVVYKLSVLPVSSEALMAITAILIPATDCVHLLHQLVIGPVTAHLM